MTTLSSAQKKTNCFRATFLVMGLFFASVIGLMMMSAKAPFGVSFAQDQIDTIQVVKTQVVEYQDSYALKRNFIGIIEAAQSSQSGFEVSGLLKSVLVDEGNSVQQGDVLAELDTVRLEARQREANAALKRAEADAKLAESTFKRIAQARDVNAVSAQERDEAEEACNTARAAVDVAKAQLETIQVDIEKSQIIAPFDGVIIERMRDAGTVVNASDPILHIQQSGALEVRVGVTPKLADNLQVGQSKTLFDNGNALSGTISRILPVRADNRAVEIIITLDQENGFVRAGDVFPAADCQRVDCRRGQRIGGAKWRRSNSKT